ncbi:MAG: hypothetical protein WBD40_03555 [Tepidisphaeraceae bacterium]
MSTRLLRVTYKRNGVLTDVTSVVLRDPGNTFGVQRTDTSATVVAAGVAMTRVSLGVYEHSLTDPAPGLTYRYYRIVTYNGVEQSAEKFSYAPADATATMYLPEDAEADAISATLPNLTAYIAASTTVKRQARALATERFDTARRYQGRKVDEAQLLEFPRVASESGAFPHDLYRTSPTIDGRLADAIWDWDADAGEAVVPPKVLRAVLFEANSIIAGTRAEAIDAINRGLTSQSTGRLSESYRAPGDAGGIPVLCTDADRISRFYALGSGEVR